MAAQQIQQEALKVLAQVQAQATVVVQQVQVQALAAYKTVLETAKTGIDVNQLTRVVKNGANVEEIYALITNKYTELLSVLSCLCLMR